MEIERIDNAAKTYPRNFLLRINLVVLRGRSKVQVPFAISAAYSHPVYLVFARSSVQTENRKKVYAYTDCLSLSLSLLNPADPNDFVIPTLASAPSPTFHAVPSRKQISRDEFHRRLRELVPVKIRVKTPLTFVASAESMAVKVRRKGATDDHGHVLIDRRAIRRSRDGKTIVAHTLSTSTSATLRNVFERTFQRQ